jgi:hypothetical protein
MIPIADSDAIVKPPNRGLLRREWAAACISAAVLLWINLYICRDLFFGPRLHMNSMQGSWAALAKWGGSSWFGANWWPFWDVGVPFEYTYAPLLPGLAALWSAVARVPHVFAFSGILGMLYCLAPLNLFFMAWRLTRSVMYSFLGALIYSLAAITQILVPDQEFGLTKIADARRLLLLVAWDEGPHFAAVTLLPLVIFCLARAMETRRKGWYAAAAISMAGAALASAFGPVITLLASGCLVAALGGKEWQRNAGVVMACGAWAWAIAAPFLTPSLILAIRGAAAASSEDERWSAGSITALAIAATGWAVLWGFIRRIDHDRWLRFFALFGYLTWIIPFLGAVIHRHFLPMPDRYWMEGEMAASVAAAFLARRWLSRAPARVRYALMGVVMALAIEQTMHYRRAEKLMTKPIDVADTVEYRASVWTETNLPGARVFLPGSVAQWANAFTGVPQYSGGSFTMSTNLEQRLGRELITWSSNPAQVLTWLKAFGVAAVGISGKDSKEFWHPFNEPEKLEATLQKLWTADGVSICRVPLRETGLAHVVPRAAIVAGHPQSGDDTPMLEKYVAALDDSSLPLTQFAWATRNRIRIGTSMQSAQVLSVQVTYHPGWRAVAGGRKLRIQKDGLGLMWMETGCSGPCEVHMEYDGGWELRICRWTSWLALAGVVFALVRRVRG